MNITDTSNMDYASWVNERKKYIGGSDTGGILNISPYSTPLTIWKIKKGLLEVDETINMRKGNDLEPLIMKKFMEKTGKTVWKPEVMYHHPEYPFMVANVDGIVDDESAIFEAKYVSLNGEDAWSDGVPPMYYSQVQHYMSILDKKLAYVVALFESTWDIVVYEIKRNSMYIEKKLIPAEIEFYDSMQEEIPPFPASPSEIFDDVYMDVKEKLVVTDGVDDLLTRYISLNNQKKELESQIEELKAKMIVLTGANQEKTSLEGTTHSATLSWTVGRRYFDQKRFKEEHSELYDKYQSQSDGYYIIRTKAKKGA